MLYLQEKCGHEYTLKIEQMIKDVHISEDLISEYKKNSGCDSDKFSVMVLTANSWPLSSLPNVILPIEVRVSITNIILLNFFVLV